MTSTVMILLGLAVIVAVCFAATWFVDSRRHQRRGAHIDRQGEALVNEQRLYADEERYADRSIDPRNRMR